MHHIWVEVELEHYLCERCGFQVPYPVDTPCEPIVWPPAFAFTATTKKQSETRANALKNSKKRKCCGK